jgi:hypothetical protein
MLATYPVASHTRNSTRIHVPHWRTTRDGKRVLCVAGGIRNPSRETMFSMLDGIHVRRPR